MPVAAALRFSRHARVWRGRKREAVDDDTHCERPILRLKMSQVANEWAVALVSPVAGQRANAIWNEELAMQQNKNAPIFPPAGRI